MELKQNKISLIEKYNCKNLYFELVECLENNKDGKIKNCNENIKKIGECVIKGMKSEEKMNKN